jgi:subtilisin family serine protease
VPAVVQTLEADGAVISAQPNYLFALTQADQSDDPTEGDPAQYALAKLHLALAHRFATGTRVRVAVIDSGVDIGNPDLAGDIAASFDPVGKGEKVHKHGTAVAGVIAAHGRLMGAAPAAQLLVVRAFADDAGDDGTTFAITQGLDWAAQNGARVINMSFTGPQDPQIARHIASAYDKGIVLVAAMGNMGPDSPSLYPAADSHVIAVTATDADDALPEFASHGNHVAVAAPGVDLMMLAPDGQLQFSSGTSFSAPFVSGTIALMLERRPGLTPAEARRTLMQTAKDLGPKGFDPEFGAGLVDAYKAVMSVAPATVGTARR